MKIPILAWAPDLGPYSTTSTDQVQNLLPLANGWGPLPTLSTVSASLGAACVGAAYYRASDGSFGLIAGTATALYKLDTTDGTWDDVSGASAPYAVPSGQLWQFERFGSKLYATNLEDPLQVFDVDTPTTFSDAPGSPPQAKYIRTMGDFLVLAYLKIGADEYPQTIHWSGLNNAEEWDVGETFSDQQTLPDGDEIMGLTKSIIGGRIIQRNAKKGMQRDPQYVFRISDIDPDNGAVAPYAIVPIGADDYIYLAEDGFYRGDARQPIGAEKVNRYFFEDVDLDELDTVQGATDPFDKLVWFTYLDGNGTRKSIGYDWQLDRWCRSDIAVAIFVGAVTAGYTLEGLDPFGTMETLTASLDSRIWKGGRPTLSAFTSDFLLKSFTGANAAAEAQTCAIEPIPGWVTFLDAVRVETNSDSFTVAVATSPYHGATETWGSAASYSTLTGLVPFMVSSRVMRFKVSITAGDVWTHLSAVDVTKHIQPDGDL